MFTVNRIGIGFCILRMLKIFSGGREPEVEGDGSQRFILKGGAEDGGSRCRVNVVTPYKKCNIINMHSVHTMLLL